MSIQLEMNPDKVDQLADRLDRSADELMMTMNWLKSMLESSTWAGSDYDRFTKQWNGAIYENFLNAVEQMSSAALTARSNAEGQRATLV